MMNAIEFKEFMVRADEAENWSDIEPEERAEACESVGLNYSDYDDPDRLWNDLTAALKEI